MSFKSIIDYKEVSSLVSFITSIVFNDLFGVEGHTYWTYD